ncbi:MAG: WYL domain-containing protein, partial [Oscillospiraceae bacterium]
MEQQVSKGTKILYILKFLWENTDQDHRAKSADISDYLLSKGISAERKSIYSDIALIKEFGVPIENDKGKNGGYYIDDRIFEIAELKILLDSVASSKFITEKKSNILMDKLQKMCNKFQAQQLKRNIFVTNRLKSENESIIYNVDFINTAINENKKVVFKYFDYNIEKKQVFRHNGKIYIVSPYALVLDNNNYYLVGSEGDGNIKHYRLDKMNNINISDEKREKSCNDFDGGYYAQKHFSMYGGEMKRVTIR